MGVPRQRCGAPDEGKLSQSQVERFLFFSLILNMKESTFLADATIAGNED